MAINYFQSTSAGTSVFDSAAQSLRMPAQHVCVLLEPVFIRTVHRTVCRTVHNKNQQPGYFVFIFFSFYMYIRVRLIYTKVSCSLQIAVKGHCSKALKIFWIKYMRLVDG